LLTAEGLRSKIEEMKMTREDLAVAFFAPVYSEHRGIDPQTIAAHCYELADEFLAESLGRPAIKGECHKLSNIRAILADSPRYAAELMGASAVARAYDRLVEQLEEVLEDE
jgi:hypothetical protein